MKNLIYIKAYFHRPFFIPGFLILFLLFFPNELNGQKSYGGRPFPLSPTELEKTPVAEMPRFNIHDARKKTEMKLRESNLKKLDFARSFEVDFTPDNSGKWTVNSEGTRIWRLIVHSRNAHSINIIFNRFLLSPGATLFLYNPDQSDILGGFNHLNNRPSGTLAVSPLPGDRVVLELQVLPGADNWGELSLGSVSHDFMGVFGQKSQQFGLSGKCNIDINCPEGDYWQMEKNSVVRLVINGNSLCTGVLLNNAENDGTPYLLTANHCIDSESKAANTVFLFNFESPSCNGPGPPANNTLSGSDLKATSTALDFTLVEFDTTPPREYRPFLAGWSRSSDPADSTAGIHHPMGDVKKISMDFDNPSVATFGLNYVPGGSWRVNKWDIGTTEGGSSGSPLFDQNRRVVGTLIGGDAYCGHSVNDYYSRFDMAWDYYPEEDRQLMAWLDPEDKGVTEVDGLNPYAESDLKADFEINSSEVCDGSHFVFTDYSTGAIDAYFWDFGEGAEPATSVEPGPHFVLYESGGTKTVTLRVDSGEEYDIIEREADLSIMTENLPVASFDYETGEQQNGESVRINFFDQSLNAATYYWEFGNRTISTLQNPTATYFFESNYEVMLMIRNMVCTDRESKTVEVVIEEPPDDPPFADEMSIYPVPATENIYVELSRALRGPGTVRISNIKGQLVKEKKYTREDYLIEVNIQDLSPGIYLVNVFNNFNSKVKKISVF